MRQVVLDVETTGLDVAAGHRMIEIGCIEILNRRITENTFHRYVNPGRRMEHDALEVHGITEEFLQDKPKFTHVAEELCQFVKDSEVIIHNAPFDVGFINYELKLVRPDLGQLSDYCEIFDTLVLARKLHPGQRNNLDALCKRYHVDASNRSLHGGLLDSELLARVYLLMTGGQSTLFGETQSRKKKETTVKLERKIVNRQPLPIITADAAEQLAHEKFLQLLDKRSEGCCLWSKEMVQEKQEEE